MVDAGELVARIRASGANVVIDGGKLRIVNPKKLPDGALEFIKRHGKVIAVFLDREGEFEERAAIIEYDGGTPREWAEQFAKVLTQHRPHGVDELDWSWFLTTCGKIIDEFPHRSAA